MFSSSLRHFHRKLPRAALRASPLHSDGSIWSKKQHFFQGRRRTGIRLNVEEIWIWIISENGKLKFCALMAMYFLLLFKLVWKPLVSKKHPIIQQKNKISNDTDVKLVAAARCQRPLRKPEDNQRGKVTHQPPPGAFFPQCVAGMRPNDWAKRSGSCGIKYTRSQHTDSESYAWASEMESKQLEEFWLEGECGKPSGVTKIN